MKRVVLVLMAMLLILTAACGVAADSESAKQSVVRLYVEIDCDVYNATTKGYEGSTTLIGMGSGFAVGAKGKDPEYFVTNKHVADDEATMESDLNSMYEEIFDVTSIRYYIILSNVNEKIPVNVVAYSDRADLALVKANTPITARVPMAIREFKDSEINGETVYALGFPANADVAQSGAAQDQLYSDIKQISKTSGVVSRVLDHSQTSEGEKIQIDATISGGNSGGPLVDEKGRLLGVNTSGLNGVDINYAVSSNEVARLLLDEGVPYFRDYGLSTSVIALIVIGLLIVVVVVLIIMQSGKNKKESKKSQIPASATRHLVGDAGAMAGKRIRLTEKVVIGRDPAKCQLVVPKDTPGVSGVHCTVRFDGKVVTVTDENSKYGTMIDGKRIAPGQPVVLHRGHQLQLGTRDQAFTLHS